MCTPVHGLRLARQIESFSTGVLKKTATPDRAARELGPTSGSAWSIDERPASASATTAADGPSTVTVSQQSPLPRPQPLPQIESVSSPNSAHRGALALPT